MATVSAINEIATLFSKILQGVEYIQLVRGFEDDLKVHQLRLDVIQLRLSRWGQATGLCLDTPEGACDTATEGDGVNRTLADHAEAVEDLLEKINDVLEAARAESEKMKPKTDDGQVVPVGADDNLTPDLKPARFKRLQLKIRYLVRKRYHQAEGHLNGVKWAMYKKDQCESLTAKLTELIGQLEELAAPEGKLEELSQEECNDMGDSLRTLLEIVGTVDPHLEAAARELNGESVAREVSVSAINNNGMQIGVSYGEIKGITFGAGSTTNNHWN